MMKLNHPKYFVTVCFMFIMINTLILLGSYLKMLCLVFLQCLLLF